MQNAGSTALSIAVRKTGPTRINSAVQCLSHFHFAVRNTPLNVFVRSTGLTLLHLAMQPRHVPVISALVNSDVDIHVAKQASFLSNTCSDNTYVVVYS